MIQLFFDSIFNSTCDLLIIPCNNKGGMTSIVRNNVKKNGLPKFSQVVSPGEIVFLPTTGISANASVVGYAATVDTSRKQTTEKSLEKILEKIKIYCKEESLQKVNIPLLGTGAGGLDSKMCYELMSSYFSREPSISLCVYTISSNTYQLLREENPTPAVYELKNPRVFISYTGTDPNTTKWVTALATKLCDNGVNARLDIFHLKPGNDLPQWMTNELSNADKVLLICDKHYAEKANNHTGGVGWETMIIQGDMIRHQDQNKYIAIIRDKNITECLPVYIKSKYALNWSNEATMEQNFRDLLLYLFDCNTAPKINEIPEYIKNNHLNNENPK